MNMPMCSRCKKNIAVVFITKIEGPDKTTQEGLCLKCARELGVKPLDNIMEQMGITEDDLEALSGEIGSLSDLNDLVPAGSDGTDDDAPHETDPVAAGTLPGQPAGGSQEETRTRSSRKEDKKRKYLNNYCENLTQKAAEGRIDHIVGRDRETDRVIQILNRRQKNNPCLIGEPGVGKTAVMAGYGVAAALSRFSKKAARRRDVLGLMVHPYGVTMNDLERLTMPTARPVHADAHRPAAVVRPLTCWRPVTRMVPAPRKPMPLMTCAPKRETSVFMPISAQISDHGPVTMVNSYRLSSTVSAAPRQTSI